MIVLPYAGMRNGGILWGKETMARREVQRRLRLRRDDSESFDPISMIRSDERDDSTGPVQNQSEVIKEIATDDVQVQMRWAKNRRIMASHFDIGSIFALQEDRRLNRSG